MFYAIGFLQEVDQDGAAIASGHSWWVVLGGPYNNREAARIGLAKSLPKRPRTTPRSAYQFFRYEIVDGYDLPDYGLPINNVQVKQAALDVEAE